MWNVATLPGLDASSGVVGRHSVGGGATRGALPKIPSGDGSQYERRIADKSVGPADIRPHGCGPLVWLPLGRRSSTDACWRSEERRVGKECRSRWWPYQ